MAKTAKSKPALSQFGFPLEKEIDITMSRKKRILTEVYEALEVELPEDFDEVAPLTEVQRANYAPLELLEHETNRYNYCAHLAPPLEKHHHDFLNRLTEIVKTFATKPDRELFTAKLNQYSDIIDALLKPDAANRTTDIIEIGQKYGHLQAPKTSGTDINPPL